MPIPWRRAPAAGALMFDARRGAIAFGCLPAIGRAYPLQPVYVPVAGAGRGVPDQGDAFQEFRKNSTRYPNQEWPARRTHTAFTGKEKRSASSGGPLFAMLSDDELLSVLIRVPRVMHKALAATCKRFRLAVRGKVRAQTACIRHVTYTQWPRCHHI